MAFDAHCSVREGAVFAAIITAAGSSSRMGGVKKEFLPLPGEGITVLGKTALAFASIKCLQTIVITVPPGGSGEWQARAALPPRLLARTDTIAAAAPDGPPPLRFMFVPGAKTRRGSVHHGLSLLAAYQPDYVLIHDGARPWVSAALIRRVMDAAAAHGAAIPLFPLTDTPKEIDENGFIIRHLKRSATGGAQTPQGFRFPEILAAHEKAAEAELAGKEYTDDAEVWGEFVGPVASVSGEKTNKKITYMEDLETGT
jgi:2-C-methyl-D-erythritol 4-phosphate cytidylyltransferase